MLLLQAVSALLCKGGMGLRVPWSESILEYQFHESC